MTRVLSVIAFFFSFSRTALSDRPATDMAPAAFVRSDIIPTTGLGSLSLMFGRDRDEIEAEERRANGEQQNS